MPELFRYLFGDTVERHISPARYRLEKVAHVTLLGALGWPVLGPEAVLVAGLLYFLAGVYRAAYAGTYCPADKLRDAALCTLPGFVALGWWWWAAGAVVVNLLFIRVQD